MTALAAAFLTVVYGALATAAGAAALTATVIVIIAGSITGLWRRS
ncbi:hypothetical protein [Streptomyces sp. NPDC088785]